MNILHYTLGLPPYRSGGLTKYATDLMVAQGKNGDTVSLLYPGDYTFWRKPKMRIKRNKMFGNIQVFEIINPSLVPLLHGVKNPTDILHRPNELTSKDFEQFYEKTKPEILHIHTLMGLPMEFVVFFKIKGVKIIFTSHDYYGLCLKVNFINQDGLLCNSPRGVNCARCNLGAPNSLFLNLRNSKYVLKYKGKLSTKINTLKSEKLQITQSEITCKQTNKFDELLSYYKKMFNLIDCFHFNSTISKEIYEQHISPKQSYVIPISHANIQDNRKIKKFNSTKLQLAFIGNLTDYKGFPMLKKVLCELNKEMTNWSLQVWGGPKGIDKDCNRIIYKGSYSPEFIDQIFNNIDMLIVPSIWKETFSLISLEAIANGTPCLVSEYVGAKDVIKQYNSEFVFYPSEEALFLKLERILNNSLLLEDFNKQICTQSFDYSLENHITQIKQLYNNIL